MTVRGAVLRYNDLCHTTEQSVGERKVKAMAKMPRWHRCGWHGNLCLPDGRRDPDWRMEIF
jgi:hypothetical protein